MASPLDVINPITISNYGKVAWNGLAENFPITNLLSKKGNIRKNVGGLSLTWPLEAGRHDVYVVDDYQDVTAYYTPRKRWAQPTIAWGEAAAFRAISKGELRQNSGAQRLVDFASVEIPAMFRDIAVATNGIYWQFLNQNGVNYTGTGKPLFGLPSVFTGNSAITWSSNTKTGTINNTSYAGLSCVLSGLSSTVDGAEADAWTPSAVNTTSTAFGATTPTFAGNFFAIMADAISRTSRFSGSDTSLMPDCALLTRQMYTDGQTAIAGKQSFLLTGKVGKDAQFGIGSDAINGLLHNGLPMYWDFNLPANTGYILNFSQIFQDSLPLLQFSNDKTTLNDGGPVDDNVSDPGMFETEVRFNDGRRAVTVSVTFPGQFRINPRYQTLLFAGA